MDKVTRNDIASMIKRELGFTLNDSYKIVDLFFEDITNAILSGYNVKIPKFGSFLIKSKNMRIGRNPKTGETAFILPRKTVVFKISEEFRKIIKS